MTRTSCPAAALLATAASLALSSAAEIGHETFDYPDGAIAGRSGGTFWDWNQLTAIHSGSASDWAHVFGTPQIVSGVLRTHESGALREYNGPSTGLGGDEGAGALRGSGVVYYRVDYTQRGENAWSGMSSFEFGTERVFFGQPGGQSNPRRFGIDQGGQTALGSRSVAPNQTFDLVAELNHSSNTLRLWVDPEDGNSAPEASKIRTGSAWSSSIRLASGGPTEWDNLQVATSWKDLGLPPKSGVLLAETFAGYNVGSLPGQAVTSTGFGVGASWQGDGPAESTFASRSVFYPGLLPAGGKLVTSGDGGAGTTALLDTGSFDRAGLLDADGKVGGGDIEGSLYFAFVGRSMTDVGSGAFGGLHFYLDGNERTLIGNSWPESNFGASAEHTATVMPLSSANPDQNGGLESIDTDSHFFIGRIDFRAGEADDLTIWLDPDLSAPELDQSASLTTRTPGFADLAFDAIHFRSGNGNPWEFDDLRMGTTWDSVLPTPYEGDLIRVQTLGERLVRVEIRGPQGFEDRETFTVVGRDWDEVPATTTHGDGETVISTASYRVRIPADATSLEGIRIESPSGELLHELAATLPANAYLPSPEDAGPVWLMADHPRLVPPPWGATPPPDSSDPQSGWD